MIKEKCDIDRPCYYYRNRYYHAPTGRFISMDPIGLKAGDTNGKDSGEIWGDFLDENF